MRIMLDELKKLFMPVVYILMATMAFILNFLIGYKLRNKIISDEWLEDVSENYLKDDKSIKYLALNIAIILYFLNEYNDEIKSLFNVFGGNI